MKLGNSNTPPEERLDAAIVLVVREMVDVEPRAHLRGRVIERLERRDASVGRVFRPGGKWTWLMAPVAAAAVVVLAVVLWWPNQPLVTRAVTQIVVRPVDTRLPPPIPHRDDRPHSASRTPTVTREDRQIAAPVLAETQPGIEVEPLRPIAAITTRPVALRALDTQQIGPLPLAPLAQIAIEPVNSSAGRN